jgi:hypothetical protein
LLDAYEIAFRMLLCLVYQKLTIAEADLHLDRGLAPELLRPINRPYPTLPEE